MAQGILGARRCIKEVPVFGRGSIEKNIDLNAVGLKAEGCTVVGPEPRTF